MNVHAQNSSVRLIAESALFDADYYIWRNDIDDLRGMTAAQHFVALGGEKDYNPHPLFNVAYYKTNNPNVRENPLVHYLRCGFLEFRNPHPLFDVAFYYGQMPALEEGGIEPLEHYLSRGFAEGLEPHWLFSGELYLARNEDLRSAGVNPLLHYVTTGRSEGRDAGQMVVGFAPEPQARHEILPAARPGISASIRLIAFYLPQFHPFPENDRWWGRGFTEWSNTVRATPQYEGHYQPHVPADLGFYDLRLPEVQAAQVDLARTYGVGGFCFYFYWFAGHRLMERPIRQFADANYGFPFCLCWANENWTRRWDGLDSEILIAQDHSPEDDLAFIAHLAAYLRHGDYIRVEQKPLVMVYRPSLLPDPAATATRWRVWCRENGIGEIYLAYTQSFEAADPRDYGFDGAIEFPPNNSGPPNITDDVERLNPDFSGAVYDYRVFPERSRSYATPAYPLFRGVFPSWDNEARRSGRGTSFLHASPALYREWLENAGQDTVERFPDPDDRLVFVNAWNEWAEGAHLEPDQEFGHAWLEATRDALNGLRAPAAPRRLALVTHDCYRHGAQYLTLNIARELAGALNCRLDLVTLGDGPWKERFAEVGPLHDLTGRDPEGEEAQAVAAELVAAGCTAALCSTTVSGLFAGVLKRAGLRVVTLVHEMPGIIDHYGLARHARTIAAESDVVVFPATIVRDGFTRFASVPADRIVEMGQGLSRRNASRTLQDRDGARARLRARFGLAQGTRIVLAMAFGDHRKGVDLFVEAGRMILAQDPSTVFLWVGELEHTIAPQIRQAIAGSGYADRLLQIGFQDDTDDLYAGADVYALTSREDPFPIAAMEAMEAWLPVVAVRGTGGTVPLVESGCGLVAEDLTAASIAACIARLLADDALRAACGAEGRRRMHVDYAFRRYAQDLLKLLDPSYQRISVVAPNYNYARYLPERLATIDRQTVRPYEIVVLDDRSTDDSLAVIDATVPRLETPTQVVVNDRNSGSVFRQWLRGVEMTSGDLVWIAEVDDLSELDFLEEAQGAFVADPAVVLSFTQSRMMSPEGALGADYLDYVSDVSGDRWRRAYVADGAEEVRNAFAVKNTIPNVSGVLFRRDVLLRVLRAHIDEIAGFRVAGDWFTYVKVLEEGRIAFSPRPLNHHRRHAAGLTISSFDESLWHEIVAMQERVQAAHPGGELDRAKARGYAAALRGQLGLGA